MADMTASEAKTSSDAIRAVDISDGKTAALLLLPEVRDAIQLAVDAGESQAFYDIASTKNQGWVDGVADAISTALVAEGYFVTHIRTSIVQIEWKV